MAEDFNSMSLNNETNNEKERCECQRKLSTIKINDNQLLIKIKKWKKEVLMLKTRLEKGKKRNES